MSNGECITLSCLPEEVASPELTALQRQIETSAPAKAQSVASEGHSWSTMEQAEKKVILDALKQHQWQILKAAKEIGIGRSTMYRKMEKYEIVPPNKR
jgi:transcriptional regulator of acetoin/glycerol metabolism